MKNQNQTTRMRPPGTRDRQQRRPIPGWLEEESLKKPVLRFSPAAWAKLLYFRDRSENEIGGFGITPPDDLLLVQEFITVEQEVTGVSVTFNDEAVGQLFDEQVDLGRKPEQFARIWCHTHPDMSPAPSTTDEETFQRVFGSCQWAVMFILARDDKSHARLRFNVGPGGEMLIPVGVDYSREFGSSDREAWDAEYQVHVRVMDWLTEDPRLTETATGSEPAGAALPCDVLAELENMGPAQRRLVLDELAERPELWTDGCEEIFL